MITRLLKILIAAASLAYMVMLYAQGSWGAAIGMTFVSIVLVLVNLRSVRLWWRLPTSGCNGWKKQ